MSSHRITPRLYISTCAPTKVAVIDQLVLYQLMFLSQAGQQPIAEGMPDSIKHAQP